MDADGPETPVGDAPESVIGTLLADRYELTRLVSSGANTVIFDARDTRTGRTVTLKVVQPELAADASFRERFERVIRDAASLSHPNIAAIYDWGTAAYGGADTVFVVIEHLTAGSLRDMFDRGRRLSPSQALAVGLDVCRALDHAHRRGFVHGELTPSKIVFGDDRRLRVVDFGLAELLGEIAWQEPATVATHVARYASPEQALSMPIDGKTDVYALCLSLVQAVSGELPFAAGSTVATLSARIGRLMPVSADLGPLASVLERAGRPDAADRSTASEFGRGLVQAAEKLPRPEPLPLLSSLLFETPPDRLRTPDDPTGGVTRPPGAAPRLQPPTAPAPTAASELLVVPLDTDDGAPGADAPAASQAVPTTGDDTTAGDATAAETTAGEAGVATVGEPADAHDDGGAHEAADDDDLVIVPVAELVDDEAPDSAIVAGADPTPQVLTESPDDTEPVTVLTDLQERYDGTYTADDGGPPVEERRRRRIPWKLIVPVVLLLAFAALGVVAWNLFSTPVYAVPDLVGLEQAEASNEVARFDWEVSVETERSDAEPRAGHVIRTVPPAGEELAEAEPFLLVVSEGPTLRPLPDLAGLAAAEAQTRLVELGLVGAPSEAFHEEVPAGTVISWAVPSDPAATAGTEVLPDVEVAYVVSRGPAPRVVPDLTGRVVEEAIVELEADGLVLETTKPVFSDTVPAGVIISQDVAPETEVARGSTITVVPSKGPDVVTMPDITTLPYAEAAAALTDAGFTPVLAMGATDGSYYSATVEGVEVAAGEVFPRGTQVDLVYL